MAKKKSLWHHVHDVVSHGARELFPKQESLHGLMEGLSKLLPHIGGKKKEEGEGEEEESKGLKGSIRNLVQRLDKLIAKLDSFLSPRASATSKSEFKSPKGGQKGENLPWALPVEGSQTQDLSKKVDDLTGKGTAKTGLKDVAESLLSEQKNSLEGSIPSSPSGKISERDIPDALPPDALPATGSSTRQGSPELSRRIDEAIGKGASTSDFKDMLEGMFSEQKKTVSEAGEEKKEPSIFDKAARLFDLVKKVLPRAEPVQQETIAPPVSAESSSEGGKKGLSDLAQRLQRETQSAGTGAGRPELPLITEHTHPGVQTPSDVLGSTETPSQEQAAHKESTKDVDNLEKLLKSLLEVSKDNPASFAEELAAYIKTAPSKSAEEAEPSFLNELMKALGFDRFVGGKESSEDTAQKESAKETRMWERASGRLSTEESKNLSSLLEEILKNLIGDLHATHPAFPTAGIGTDTGKAKEGATVTVEGTPASPALPTKEGSPYGDPYDWKKAVADALKKGGASDNLTRGVERLMTRYKTASEGKGGESGGAGGGGESTGGGGSADGGTGGGGGLLDLTKLGVLLEGIKLNISNFKHLLDSVKSAHREGFNAFKSERLEDVGYHATAASQHMGSATARVAGSAIGGVLGSAGGPGGALIGAAAGGGLGAFIAEHNPFYAIAEAGFKAVGFLRDFSAQLMNANMQFAEFSGGMATVQAIGEVQQIILSMQRGERRAPSAAMLQQANFRTQMNLAPIEDKWANIKNDVMTGLNELFNNFIGDHVKNLGPFMDNVQSFLRAVMPWVKWKEKQAQAEALEWSHVREAQRMRDFFQQNYYGRGGDRWE